MEYIKNFNSYNDDLILEKLNLRSILDKFKSATSNISKKVLAHTIVIGLLSLYTLNQASEFINNMRDVNDYEKSLLIQQIEDMDKDGQYKYPSEFRLSKEGWSHIKEHEGLRLKAYKLGDGMVTIGYGHAERIKRSQFRVGQKITQEKANELLIKDVNLAAEGVKRMFRQWKEDEGVDIKITQNQYDVLISLAFNMGITGLRRSEFAQTLKRKGIDKAANLIKTTGINKKFPSLDTRRSIEYEKFIKEI